MPADTTPPRVATTIADSTPHWSDPARPPDDAPNVLSVLLDDVGFSDFGCFATPPTPPPDLVSSPCHVPVRSIACFNRAREDALGAVGLTAEIVLAGAAAGVLAPKRLSVVGFPPGGGVVSEV
jgi:hypothetical protein